MKVSKTAAASMKGGLMAPKADPFDTNEKKIKELRNQRRDKLAVARYDFIDALFEEFDKVVKQNQTDLYVAKEISAARDQLGQELKAAREINQTLLKVNEKLNGELNMKILQLDEAVRQSQTHVQSESEKMQAELEPLPETEEQRQDRIRDSVGF